MAKQTMIQARPAMASTAVSSHGRSIFHNRPFMTLWAAQFVSQTAQQAIWFGMIVVVEQVSQSSAHLSAAILSTIIPGILFGLFAGVVVDRSNKKAVLVTTNFLRAATVLGYLLYHWSLYAVYGINFLFVAISQFFGPAEASTIPALVPRRDLVTANSLFNLTFTISQLVGIVLLAPWVIKFLGAPALFITVAGIYVVAGILTSLLPPGVPPERGLGTLRRDTVISVIRSEVLEAWRFIRFDRRTWWAMIFVTMASTLMLILAMLAPRYVVVIIGIQPEDAVYLFAPAGIAIFLMTVTMDRLVRRVGEMPLAYVGGIISSAALVGLAVIPRLIGPARQAARSLLPGIVSPPGGWTIVPVLMALSAAIGVGFALSTIPCQSVLMERAPVQSRGRIFSVLLMMGNVAAIVPLAFLGEIADLIGVSMVIGLVGVATMAITLFGLREWQAVTGVPQREVELPLS
ncbi:MAG: MFS transporter [Chloroflexi bacterium]|nr:MFS transporter [Chloroflexota bacterium]